MSQSKNLAAQDVLFLAVIVQFFASVAAKITSTAPVYFMDSKSVAHTRVSNEPTLSYLQQNPVAHALFIAFLVGLAALACYGKYYDDLRVARLEEQTRQVFQNLRQVFWGPAVVVGRVATAADEPVVGTVVEGTPAVPNEHIRPAPETAETFAGLRRGFMNQ